MSNKKLIKKLTKAQSENTESLKKAVAFLYANNGTNPVGSVTTTNDIDHDTRTWSDIEAEAEASNIADEQLRKSFLKLSGKVIKGYST